MANALFNITCVAVFVALVALTSVQSQNARIGLGYYCSNYSQCANSVRNSYCYLNKCQCQPGYLQLTPTNCSLALGYRCTNNTQCQVANSYCNSSRTCGCSPGYVQRSTTSCVKAQPSLSCITLGCAQYGPGGYCNPANGYCYCRGGYILERNHCYYIRSKVGDSCNTNTDVCYLQNGSQGVECNNKKCKCKKGFKESKDKRACNRA